MATLIYRTLAKRREELKGACIRDRVVQTTATLVLGPILEADLTDNAYAYRPRKSALDAIQRVHTLLQGGYTDVVDADLSKYFDEILHA
jgi:RNA-directed DNA polymerase